MKGMLRMATSMGAGSRYFQTGIDMKDSMQMENLKEMGCIVGKMGRCIKANLKMESVMAMGIGHLETKATKEITLTTKEMGKECTNGEAVAIIRANLWMIYGMDSVKCIGIKTPITKVNGEKAHSQGKVKFGKMGN